MKKIVIVLVLVIGLSGCTSSIVAGEQSRTVSMPSARLSELPYLDMDSIFPDNEFREVILNELEQIYERRENFTQEDLNGVTSISCNSSVVGIRYLCNLKTLYVHCDITAGQDELGQLENLSKIEIYKSVTNLEPFSEIHNAQTWYVSSFSQIADISIISTLNNVETLEINMDIFDWEIIKLFPNLKKISLYEVDMEDCDSITALKDSPTLEILKFEDSSIDLGALSALNNIIVLETQYPVYATNCSSIDGFESLEILDYPEPDFGLDIKGLDNIPNLKELNLGCAYLDNINTISKMTNLEILDLTYCTLGQDGEYEKDLEDIGFLEGLKDLYELNLQENGISDIRVLSSLVNLRYLDLKDNNISDISTLSDLTNLVELDISDNNITDLTPLLSLPNLKILDVSGNPIEDYSVLDQLDLDELVK